MQGSKTGHMENQGSLLCPQAGRQRGRWEGVEVEGCRGPQLLKTQRGLKRGQKPTKCVQWLPFFSADRSLLVLEGTIGLSSYNFPCAIRERNRSGIPELSTWVPRCQVAVCWAPVCQLSQPRKKKGRNDRGNAWKSLSLHV